MTLATLHPAALDYAWWLTGDVDLAAVAVAEAEGFTEVRAAGPAHRLEALLTAVRAVSISSPTMRPGSELALLHDGHGVPLRAAAAIVGVAADDAPTVLAQGRLEALRELPETPMPHPERLGGLVAGNTDDLAHARDCHACAEVQDLLSRGREEVTALHGGLPVPAPEPGDDRAEPADAPSVAAAPAAPAVPAAPAEPAAPVAPADQARPERPAAARAPAPDPRGAWFLAGGALAGAAIAGLLAAASPAGALLVAAVVGVVAAVAAHPPLAAYGLLAITPLIAGMDRGGLFPLLRPNEALIVLLAAGLAVHGLIRLLRGRGLRVAVTPVHVTLAFMAITASVVPLLWMVARGVPVTQDDLLYTVVVWKYAGVFLLVRASIRTQRQVATCLWLMMAAAAAVALVAVLQSLQLFGVPQLLATHYAPFGNESALENLRGTSTLASSIAVGDVMTYVLAIALAWLLLGNRHRVLLAGACALFVVGALGSGQFSAAIALVIGVAAVGWITGRLGRAMIGAVPAAAAGALLLRPVIERRLSGFDSPEGLPQSWVGRLENLRTFFWPELFRDFNFVLGVRPSARVAATETWREWVWMESGHTWLLWTGGIPLLLAFCAFVWTALRTVAAQARARTDAIGVAAVASFSSLWVMVALMTLDQHLTLRGSADVLFALLALALTAVGAHRASGAPRAAVARRAEALEAG